MLLLWRERHRTNRGISWPDQFSGFLSDVGTGSRGLPSSLHFLLCVGPSPPNFPPKPFFCRALPPPPSFSFLAGLVMDDESLRRGPPGWRGKKCRTENQRFFIDFVIIFFAQLRDNVDSQLFHIRELNGRNSLPSLAKTALCYHAPLALFRPPPEMRSPPTDVHPSIRQTEKKDR